MPELIWGSSDCQEREWEFALKYFENNTESNKLRRKDFKKYQVGAAEFHKLTHSFLRINGNILAMAGKHKVLGSGAFAKAKLAEDQWRNCYVLKIGDIERKEAEITEDLGVSQGFLEREVFHRVYKQCGYSKFYLLLPYLGVDLFKYKFSSDQQWLDIAVQLVAEVNQLNKGKKSISGRKIFHKDLHGHNVLVDEAGKVNLIDYTLAAYAEDLGRRPYLSRRYDMTTLAALLLTIIPAKSPCRHTPFLMMLSKPERRPRKDLVLVNLLTERHKNSTNALRLALQQYDCVTYKASEAKAISALMAASNQLHKLYARKNIKLVKSNAELKTALVAAHKYLTCSTFGFKNSHGYHGKAQTLKFIRKLMQLDEKNLSEIKKQMRKWVKGYGFFSRSSKQREDSRLSIAIESKLLSK